MATTIRGDDNFDTASPIPANNFTAKAWVKFNGAGITINSSGNVSSITDVATGKFTVNYANSVTNALHSTTMSSVSATYAMQANCTPRTGANTTTTSCSVGTGNSINGVFYDHDNTNVVCLA